MPVRGLARQSATELQPRPPRQPVSPTKALQQFFIFSIEPSLNDKALNFEYGLNAPSDIDISVVSMEDKVVQTIQIKKQKAGVSSTVDIDVSNLPTGNYFLKIKTDDAVFIRKLTVK